MSQIRMYYYYRDAPHTVYNLGVHKIFLWLILTLSSHSKQKRILYYFFREKGVPRFISRKQSLEFQWQLLQDFEEESVFEACPLSMITVHKWGGLQEQQAKWR